jgi:hypothetical protein
MDTFNSWFVGSNCKCIQVLQDTIEVYLISKIGGKQDAIIQHFIFTKYSLQYFIQGKRFRMPIFARPK